MNRTTPQNRTVLYIGIPFLLLSILIFLMKFSSLNGNDTFNFAITVDLLFTIPLIYFLLIRKSEIPKTTVIPVMIVGLLVGFYFMPKENQSYLSIFKTWGLPIIEVFMLTFTVIKVRKAIKKYKGLKKYSSQDFFSTIKHTCYEIFPKKIALPFATEVAVFYYGFINWKKRKILENEYTYHKKSGTPALFYAFILVIGIETVVIHLLLSKWNVTAAWILTTLSIYTAIQLFGFAKSLTQRPISINSNSLTLKYGILNEVEILFSDIDSVEISKKALYKNEMTRTLSPLGEIESHNIIIGLNTESKLIGLYGIQKRFKLLALHIDEPQKFKDTLDNALKKCSV